MREQEAKGRAKERRNRTAAGLARPKFAGWLRNRSSCESVRFPADRTDSNAREGSKLTGRDSGWAFVLDEVCSD